MMHVQNFIKQNGIQALSDEPLNIKIREYSDLDVYVLNYNQITSPKTNPIVGECRSLIVNGQGDILSRSFDRFFNHGENPEYYTEFDISRAVVFSKEDGSLTKLWWGATTGRWEISTRSQAFAEGEHNMGGTFRSKILHALGCSEEQFQSTMSTCAVQNLTYICEYVSPQNRIVTPYTESALVQLAVRNNSTGRYDDLNTDLLKSSMNVRLVRSWKMNNFDEIVEASKNMTGLEEGYVCYDPVSMKRVKIKSPLYVHVHHLVDNGRVSLKRLYLMVLMNEQSEFLSYYPEHSALVLPVEQSVMNFKSDLMRVWVDVCGITDQKQFALLVKDLPGSNFLFMAKRLGTNPVSVFNETDPARLLKLFDIKEELEVTEQ